MRLPPETQEVSLSTADTVLRVNYLTVAVGVRARYVLTALGLE